MVIGKDNNDYHVILRHVDRGIIDTMARAVIEN